MKTAFFILLSLHGLIHLLGFFKIYKLTPLAELHRPPSKAEGLLWLLAAVLLLVSASFFYSGIDSWWIPGISGLLVSQSVIIVNWHDARYGSILNLIILLIGIYGFSSWNFAHSYKRDTLVQLNQQAPLLTNEITLADLIDLPAPVQKYLHHCGVIGQPRVNNFRVLLSGELRRDGDSEWMPFTAEQYSFLEKPARLFFMKAEMKNMPVAGYHRYENGQAYMDIRLWSLLPVQYQSGREMAIAETVSFFNDMCIMATATLLDPRVKWLETQGQRVKASFSAHDITITAWLEFNEEGELINFSSNDRYAYMPYGHMQQVPWSTPITSQGNFRQFKLPAAADAIYHYPGGARVYGKFVIEELEYNHLKE